MAIAGVASAPHVRGDLLYLVSGSTAAPAVVSGAPPVTLRN
jgi:hypothetical protein